jgi:hypothetical protein
MRNPNKPIKIIDDQPKSKDEVAEMIKQMFNTDEDGNPEKGKINKATA